MIFINDLLIQNELIDMSNDHNDSTNTTQYATQRTKSQYADESKHATKRGLMNIENTRSKKVKFDSPTFDIDDFENDVKDAFESTRKFPDVNQQSSEYWELQHKYTVLITNTFVYIKLRKQEIENLHKDIEMNVELDQINQEAIEQ